MPGVTARGFFGFCVCTLLVLTWRFTRGPLVKIAEGLSEKSLSSCISKVELRKENGSSNRYSKILDNVQGILPVSEQIDINVLGHFGLVAVDCATKQYPIIMHNTDIIKWVCQNRGEKLVTRAMLYVFQKYAGNNSESAPGLMLDIGANAGYYGLLAAKLGHAVVQFDLQPECVSIIRNSHLANGFNDRARIVAQGVTDGDMEITVPTEGCVGTFPAKPKKRNNVTIPVQMHPLSHFITNPDQDIMLMKIDTEGNEQRVLQGAMSFFRGKKIHNAIVEFTPGYGFWKTAGIEKEDVIKTVEEILACGYVMIPLTTCSILRTKEQVVTHMFPQKPGQFDMWILPEENGEMTSSVCNNNK